MTLKTSAKRILKNPILIISFVAFSVVVSAILGWYLSLDKAMSMNTLGVFSNLSMSLDLSKYIFVFFIFFSYEACQPIRKNEIKEILNIKNGQITKMYFCHIVVLLSLAVLIFFLFFIFNIISYIVNANVFSYDYPQYVKYIVDCLLIYVFIVSFCAICIGTALSAVFNRIGAYVSIIIITALVISSSVESLTGVFSLVFGQESVFYVIDVFNILPAGLNRRVVFQTAYSILPDRVFAPLLLSAVFVFILIVYLQKRKFDIRSNILRCVSLLLCAFFAAELIIPQSKITYIRDHPSDSFLSDILSVKDEENKKAAFKVSKYYMELSIKRELSASVTVTINNPVPLDADIDFTLWNGYILASVTDGNGNNIDYKQTGNYVSVSNPVGNENIVFTYKGHSNRFFSNSQATYLAGYFPFYPIPGKCSIANQQDTYSFNDNSLDYEAEFEIFVNTNQKVFSNVTRVSDCSFKGSAHSATIMTGFLDDITIKGVKLIYPYTAYETLFAGSTPESILSESFGYNTTVSAISNMLEYGIISGGDCVIVAPSLSQQIKERFMNCSGTMFITNILFFRDTENIQDMLESINGSSVDVLSEDDIGGEK